MKLKTKLILLSIISIMCLSSLSAFFLYTEKTDMLNNRKELIKTVVEVGNTQLAFFEAKVKSGELSIEDAQTLAKDTLRTAKYSGAEYFWINDKHPRVVMHGANAKLEGNDVSELKDPNGKKLFVAFVDTVNKSGSGYVDYLWKKPNAGEEPVEKISYVQEFKPWGWILGTGLYIDDINAKFKSAALLIFALTSIIVLILLVSLFVISKNIIKDLGADPAYAKNQTDIIASGDLTSNIDINKSDSSSLIFSLSSMQSKIKSIIQTILNSALSVHRSSESLTHMSDELKHASIRQSESASAMAASVEEMVVSIDVIRSNSADAKDLAIASGQSSESGSIVIEKLINNMHNISASVKDSARIIEELGAQSDQISSIVRTIKDIADQTNLLALNAAIEAARAGEQGRGFAVVADEVRKLAERTSVATGEITVMVSKIQSGTSTAVSAMQDGVTKVEQGVESAQFAGESISEIKSSSDKVISVINDISNALEEQASASNHVAQQLENIAQMSESNLEQVKLLSDNSNELAKMSNELSESVSSFKV